MILLSRLPQRRGFALIAVLWIIVAMAALGTADAGAASDAVGSARNRINEARAGWRAEGCVEGARAVIARTLADSTGDPSVAWDTVDATVKSAASEMTSWCRVDVVAAGDRLDVNTADGDALRAVFIAAGATVDRADSIAAALLDWRDADTVTTPLGAEASWYHAAGRPAPTNAAFEDTAELALVRGLEHADTLRALLGTEPGRVVLDRAPLAVIASLPGMTPEAVGRITEQRWRHERVRDLAVLGASLSDEGRRALTSAYAVLAQRVTSEPDAWIVTARAVEGDPAVTATYEVRLVRAGRRAGVVRKRVWP